MQVLTRLFLVCVIALSTVIGPYASVSRAQAAVPAVVPYAVGTAFATVASLYGYSVASGDTDFEALGSSVIDAIDNVSVDDFNTGLSAFGTFNPVSSVVAAQTYVKEWLSSVGQAGSFNLDDLTALGDITSAYLPVILSELLSSSSGSSGGSADGACNDLVVKGKYTYNVYSAPVSPPAGYEAYSFYLGGDTALMYSTSFLFFAKPGSVKISSASNVISINATSLLRLKYDNGSWVYYDVSYSSISFESGSNYRFISPELAALIDSQYQAGTDNPDVLGKQFDDAAALDNPDVLNPGRSQALGSDAVFDGDTLVSHGNIGVLNPSDYADIDSWADALAKLRAGILEDINAAVAAGAITLESAITAALDGALVTDKVSNLNGKDTGSSISRPRNWKNLGRKFTQIFPFCLYFDLVEMIVLLDAEPVAPKFDWVVPSIWGDDFKVTFDLSPWDSAASFLRMLLTFVFAVGFVFLLLRFVNPGRDNSDDGGSKG